MVLTLSNVLQIPITIFTSIHNMPIICVLPTSETTITNQPIFLTFNHDGPGDYDIALPCTILPNYQKLNIGVIVGENLAQR